MAQNFARCRAKEKVKVTALKMSVLKRGRGRKVLDLLLLGAKILQRGRLGFM